MGGRVTQWWIQPGGDGECVWEGKRCWKECAVGGFSKPDRCAEGAQSDVAHRMSERVRALTLEEIEFLARMRLSEVEEVHLPIVQQVRQLEEQGHVTIVKGDAPAAFVQIWSNVSGRARPWPAQRTRHVSSACILP